MMHKHLLRGILPVLVINIFMACSDERAVREHFQNHGFSYPVDASEVSLLNVEYIGIERDELSAQGAREFIEEGVQFTREFFVQNKIYNYISGSTAVVLSEPVLFKDETGTVGFMIKVTAFGSGRPSDTVHETIRWLGTDRKLWSVQNYAYFGKNELYQWEYGGMVFE